MITFVTCLFNLTPYDNYTARRSISEYVSHGKNLLQQKIKLIIFLDTSLVKEIEDLKPFKCQLEIIPTNLKDIPLWQQRDKFIKAKKPNLSNDRFTPEYFLLMWSKFYFVQRAIDLHIKSVYFVWIDFGLSHVTPSDELDLLQHLPLSDKFRLCNYWTHRYPLCVDKDLILNTVWSQTPGGFWQTSAGNFSQVKPLFDNICQELLDSGRVACDEDILSYLRCKYPDLFDPYYGTYQSLIKSFCGIYSLNEWNLTQILTNLKSSTREEDHNDANKLAILSLKEITSKRFNVNNNCFKLITNIISDHEVSES